MAVVFPRKVIKSEWNKKVQCGVLIKSYFKVCSLIVSIWHGINVFFLWVVPDNRSNYIRTLEEMFAKSATKIWRKKFQSLKKCICPKTSRSNINIYI